MLVLEWIMVGTSDDESVFFRAFGDKDFEFDDKCSDNVIENFRIPFFFSSLVLYIFASPLL